MNFHYAAIIFGKDWAFFRFFTSRNIVDSTVVFNWFAVVDESISLHLYISSRALIMAG